MPKNTQGIVTRVAFVDILVYSAGAVAPNVFSPFLPVHSGSVLLQ